MYCLNNKGWGFVMFIVYLFIFLLAILTAAYMVNNYESGLSSSRGDNITYTQYETYRKYESMVKKAANSYASSNGEIMNINISDLNIGSAIKTECVGYALRDDSNSEYVVYLKCGDYESAGFSYDMLD